MKKANFVIDCTLDDIECIPDDTESKRFDLLLITRIVNSHDMQKCLPEDAHPPMDDDIKKELLDKVGMPVNGYNIGDIQKQYPDYDLSHDGTYILIEVVEKDGSLTYMNFWGD